MEGKTIIEVNGVKLEVDLRSAKRIDELRVGDRVKVLNKLYEGYEVLPGTVIGFEPFEKLPTIIVAYLKIDYAGTSIKYLYFNAQSKDVEIIKAIDDDQLDINKADVLSRFDQEIKKRKDEIEDMERRKQFSSRTSRRTGLSFNGSRPIDPSVRIESWRGR